MPELPSDFDTVIIGAGPSGLACAIQCQKNKKPFLLIEKNNRVGGRLGSFKENGYIFDLGFQVYNTAYDVTNSLLDMESVNLNYFKPGAVIHDGTDFQIISDPLRDVGQVFGTLFSNISTLGDKVRILKLKSSLRGYEIDRDNSKDKTTYKFLLDTGFSERMIEMFFRPFFAGIFLENELETSSKFFKYVFSRFNLGLASLPENGMQSIPDNLMKKIDEENVLLENKVVEIGGQKDIVFDDGKKVHANNIVLTGESRGLVNEPFGQYNYTKTLYISSRICPERKEYIHLYPCDDLINNIAIPTGVSSSYSENGDHLFSVTVLNDKISEDDLIEGVMKRLKGYYGGEKGDYKFLKCINIKKGTLRQLPGYFEHQIPQSGDIIISGEHQINGSIEGAIISGIEAANSL